MTTSKTKSVDTAVLVIVEPEKSVQKKVQEKSQRCQKEELKKHQHNLRVILQCTNATPILRRGSLGYMCSYCTEEFPEPMDLKEHTLTTHSDDKDPAAGYMKAAPMSEYCIKLDITNLNCTLCCADIDSLEDLMVHLKEKHNKTIHTDINNHILPFKFNSDQLSCCLCSNPYERFKKLQEHMHNHYRNYICEVCDTGFVTQGCLSRHANIHVKGEFPCRSCSKVFDTYLKAKSHERCNHTRSAKLNRCGYCYEGFRDYHLKEMHMSEVHGVDKKVYKCNACDKSYPLLKKLKIHIKRDHLLERGYKCVHCDMRFFTSYDMKMHTVKHTGLKEFKCPVCWKSYGRKSTLNGHMRIHNDDRRFKCEICGMAFVQKCAWKGHMRAKHEENV